MNHLSSSSPLTLRTIHDQIAWQNCLAKLPGPHVLQSWEWGEVKAQTGWKATRYSGVDQDGNQRFAFQLLKRRLPLRLPLSIGYIPKGPLLNWHAADLVAEVLDLLAQTARRERCLFIKIDPDVREDQPEGERLRGILQAHNWRYSHEQIQFKNTAFSPLQPAHPQAEEQILAQMKSKWRYNIRLAQRRGIQIRQGDESDLHTFYELYGDTGKRDGFAIRPYSYYETIWRTFLEAQEQTRNPAGGHLLFAQHKDDDAPVAGLFLMSYLHKAWYFYGASINERRRDMPNYLLQWAALQWALSQGCTCYDWWGAPTDPGNSDDGMSGVWRFKQGFGAQFQQNIGAWDWAPLPPLYYLYRVILSLTRKLEI